MNIGIIVVYNFKEKIREVIQYYLNMDCFEKIVVVDNHSTDDTDKEIAKIKHNKLINIRTEKNLGYGPGMNVGLKHIDRLGFPIKFVTLLSCDIKFEETVINDCIYVLNNDHNLAVCSAYDQTKKNYWNIPNYYTVLFNQFMIYNKISSLYKKKIRFEGKVSNLKYNIVDVVSAALAVIKFEDLKKVGFFDNNTFLYNEENILSLKLLRINKKTAILKNCSYIHDKGKSVKHNFHSYIPSYQYYFDSCFYYCTEYLDITNTKSSILRLFFYFGFMERKVYDGIKLAKRRIFR